jgi:mono/diheme cytochrome c family protein
MENKTPRPLLKRIRAFLLTVITIGSAAVGANAQTIPWVAPNDAANAHNPLTASPTVLADARTIYVANCGPCHGDKGRGDGPAAQALTPKPADHSSALVQNESDGSLFWKLSEGRNPMPSYKKVFTDQQRWELILYIRTLSKTAKKK